MFRRRCCLIRPPEHIPEEAKGRPRRKGKRKQPGYKDAIPERVQIEDIADWLPSWVLSRHLSDAELRQPLKGRSI